MLSKKYFGKSAFIVCHDSTPGPPHNLTEYLIKHNISDICLVGHVNQFVKNNRVKCSYIKIYKSGKLIKTIEGKQFQAPEIIRYVHDFFLTIYWFLIHSQVRTDYFIGLGNLNAIVGIIFKFLGKIDKTIYYVIDYVPQRFSNPIINKTYHFLDNICAKNSNATWNYGKGMIVAREKFWNKKFPHQLHTPHGVEIDRNIFKKYLFFQKNQLVYMGSLLEQQGLQLILESLQKIREIIPDISLKIIGEGEYKKNLEQIIRKKHLSTCVEILGFIENPKDVDEIIINSSLGIATYKTDIGFVVYTEPSKVRRYLSCGVPVVITAGTPLAEDVSQYVCGIVCNYDSDDTAVKIISFLKNTKKIKKMRKNAINYAKQYTWENIYTRAFNSTF